MTNSELQQRESTRSGVVGYVGDTVETSNRARKLFRLFKTYPQSLNILDVGCATGSLLAPFASPNKITGYDVSSNLLEKALQNGYQQVKVVDISSQPFPASDGEFDLVFCGEAIEHVVDTDWLLCECNRVLVPGGHLILTFPNVRTLLGVAMLAVFNRPPMFAARYRAFHVRDFTTYHMRQALANNGFKVLRNIGSDFYVPHLGGCASFLATYLPSWASTVIVQAQKISQAVYDPNNFSD